MASHVVVVDSSARRAVIKTSPGKFLSDILHEACEKLSLDSSRYGLRNNGRSLDLARTIRLSGLSSGAKLELIILSRSASVVSVALQLPESEAQGNSNQRLTDKFTSTTSLWLMLRKFESGVAGELISTRNFTARGSPLLDDGSTGAGRLYYETPVIQVMGRELVSFAELQKTLGQLGFNGGSTLLRLSFRLTEIPLEEAMEEIGNYFKAVGEDEPEGAHVGSITVSESLSKPSQFSLSEVEPESLDTPEPINTQADEEISTTQQTISPLPSANQTISGPNQRPISVFAAPTSTTLHASLQPHDERDYEPTVDHAKLHQSRLASSTRNRRLPTDAEIAAQQEVQKQKAADVKEVKIKIRFPDQTQVVSTFSNSDTSTTLYDFVIGLLENEKEPFLLNFSAMSGPKSIPREGAVKLIGGLGMAGGVLVNFIWDEGASFEARGANVLKEEFREKAKEIEVKEVKVIEVDDKQDKGSAVGKEKDSEGKGKGKGGLPKWLKLPGKK